MQSTYTIVFTESGLPSDTSWSVTLNGNTKSARVDIAADPSSIYFGVQAGTYSYSISSLFGFGPTPSSGTVSVSNGDVSISITFIPTSKTINTHVIGSCTIQPSDPVYSNIPDYWFFCLAQNEFIYDSASGVLLIISLLIGAWEANQIKDQV